MMAHKISILLPVALAGLFVLSGCPKKDHPNPSHHASTSRANHSASSDAGEEEWDGPVTLSQDEAKPYLEAIAKNEARIAKELGVASLELNLAPTLPQQLSPYASRYQAFYFPEGQTLVALETLRYVGAVVFKSDTSEILSIQPWSKILASRQPRAPGAAVSPIWFDRTFYRFVEDTEEETWQVQAQVLAITGSDPTHDPVYQVWEFGYGPESTSAGMRYQMRNAPPPAPK